MVSQDFSPPGNGLSVWLVAACFPFFAFLRCPIPLRPSNGRFFFRRRVELYAAMRLAPAPFSFSPLGPYAFRGTGIVFF